MAGYGYTYRSGYNNYNGAPLQFEEWSKTSYTSDEFDHLCRPIIIDSEGRKMPIILTTPNCSAQSFVAKVEAVVERIRAPLVIEYRHGSPPKVI